MNISEIALQMFPMWLLGLWMIWVAFRTQNQDLLRVNFKSVAKFFGFLVLLSVYRYFLFRYAPDLQIVKVNLEDVLWIPWQMTLTVFWEDAAYILPLLFLGRVLPDRWYSKVITVFATIFMMVSFGLGHLYQGIWSALLISFYVPFGLRIAKEKGLGTLMVCHVLYDLATILLIKYVVGLMS